MIILPIGYLHKTEFLDLNWNELPSTEVFKDRLDGTLSNLV